MQSSSALTAAQPTASGTLVEKICHSRDYKHERCFSYSDPLLFIEVWTCASKAQALASLDCHRYCCWDSPLSTTNSEETQRKHAAAYKRYTGYMRIVIKIHVSASARGSYLPIN